jgi:hypothetical protein
MVYCSFNAFVYKEGLSLVAKDFRNTETDYQERAQKSSKSNVFSETIVLDCLGHLTEMITIFIGGGGG